MGLPILDHWKSEYTMEDVLGGIKREMANGINKRMTQPPEEEIFTII